MRDSLLEPSIVETVYYTFSLISSTLLASGDCQVVPYILLVDAVNADFSATPKELARVLGVDARSVALAGEQFEAEGLLIRTRSPHDRRSVGFAATVIGGKHVRELDELLFQSLCSFWRCSGNELLDYMDALTPFQQTSPKQWFENDRLNLSLQSLCALHSLWREYQAFAHANTLTFSEMHQLLMIEAFGGCPDRVLYQGLNQFALLDKNALELLEREKGHLRTSDGRFELTDRGKRKVKDLHRLCPPKTPQKDESESTYISALKKASSRLTFSATFGAEDTFGWPNLAD